MTFSSVLRRGILLSFVAVLLASPLSAQIEDHLSAYTGKNATGYLNPLVNAIGATLNGGLYRSASIPKEGFTVHLEFPIMGMFFSDDDKTFSAVTEAGFTPERRVMAPTVIGPTDAVIVDGDAGTSFAFPGGFDMGSFAITSPQLRVGAVFGTEAMIRFIAFRIGDSEIGDIMLFGIGGRHSISQYFGPAPPVDVSASFFYQRFKLGENENGDDLSLTNAYSLGVQASKTFPPVLTPYTGLYYSKYKTDVTYQSETSGTEEMIDLEYDESMVQWTLGLVLELSIINVFGEYSVASTSSFSFGIGFGF
jgi:hypothetical protein